MGCTAVLWNDESKALVDAMLTYVKDRLEGSDGAEN